MTKHSDTRKSTDIVVVDGSNIATEGRSMPSLSQLNDAVTSFLEENPEATITVVVDATFGHRIPKKETKEFDEAVANNELVAPPAGAIGRGDAFVLSIANKVGARVLSNDSFQEFHGDYPWLFDEGRLIGGKPVPNIGWVFVPRVPVQGARSRKAQRDAKTKSTPAVNRRSASLAASEPLPVPTKPPPSKRTTAATKATKAVARRSADTKTAPAARAPASGPAPVNDTLPFLEFVEKHPIGTSVNAEVETYSSHGAYAIVGDVRAYIPLALMDEPAPRSARSVMSIGEALVLVVAAFSPSRRSIDLAFPHMMSVDGGMATEAITAVEAAAAAESAKPAPRRKRAAKALAEPGPAVQAAVDEAAAELAPEAPQQATRGRSKRATAAKKATPRTASATKKTAAKAASTSTDKPASKRTPAKKPAAATSPTKGTAAAKTASTGRAAAARKPAAKKTAGRKTPARKATATKTASKQTTSKQEGND